MKTSFLICNYNSDELLYKCINSINNLNNENVEIFIYDNNSSDISLNLVSQLNVKNLHIIYGQENLGYGRAINFIAKISTCENLFILNPDAEILFTKEDFVELSNSLLDNEIIGFQIINNEGKLQNFDSTPPGLFWLNSSIFRLIYPSISKIFYDLYFFLNKSNNENISKNNTFLIPGCALLLKRKLFIKLNMFNENYFLYFEDTELLHKAYNLGTNIYLSNLKINHNASYSVNKSGNEIKIERYRSYFIYIKNVTNKIYFFISKINLFFLCILAFTNPRIIFNNNKRNYFLKLLSITFHN